MDSFSNANEPPTGNGPAFLNCTPNLERGRIAYNVAVNSLRGLPEPERRDFRIGDTRAVLCGPGQSLKPSLDQVRSLAAKGCPIWALKGTWRTLAEAGIPVAAATLLDGHHSQISYVKGSSPGMRWYLASQCDPGAFDALDPSSITIWHAPSPEAAGMFPARCSGFVGGAGAASRTLRIMALEGREDIELFGVDCSWEPERPSHCYDLARGENRPAFHECDGRAFLTTESMMSEYFDIVNLFLADNGLALRVHGDAMLAHTIRYIMRIKAETGDPRFDTVEESPLAA